MNNKKKYYTLIIMICLLWLGWGLNWSGAYTQASPTMSNNKWEENEFIAHALGGIDGAKYTNSYEAFISNYHRGYRLFEVDLSQTLDGSLVARHGWSKKLQPGLSNQTGDVLSLSQFRSSLILDKFHSLTLKDILKIMQQYPDFYLILDFKETNSTATQKQFTELVDQTKKVEPALLDRFIPEIFSPEMYGIVMNIHPFPNKLYSLYKSTASAQSIIKFVKDNHISAVAMPTYRVYMNPNLIYSLNQLGVKSYVHTVNDPFSLKLLHAIGVHGFYTDIESSPQQLTLESTNDNTIVDYFSYLSVKISTTFKGW